MGYDTEPLSHRATPSIHCYQDSVQRYFTYKQILCRSQKQEEQPLNFCMQGTHACVRVYACALPLRACIRVKMCVLKWAGGRVEVCVSVCKCMNVTVCVTGCL